MQLHIVQYKIDISVRQNHFLLLIAIVNVYNIDVDILDNEDLLLQQDP